MVAGLGLTDAEPDETQNAAWLAYLSDEVTVDDLNALLPEDRFRWDSSYGEAPADLMIDGNASAGPARASRRV
ncbi:MAG TPA: hypothetical protein VF533_22700 [Solirubrobacteraceae bacterium]|jgi:esterase/lipase superfamily enzyme